MSQALVTLVVVPRERFSCTQRSLDSIYEHTQMPFELIYVDGNSPKSVQNYLEQKSQEKSFTLLRCDRYLSPNEARNIGLAHVKTKYLVFCDNDIVVSPGWLQALVQCAEETEATVVGPLMCQDDPVHEVVHFAGGDAHVWSDRTGRKRLREKMYRQGQRVDTVKDLIQRQQTELAEFHCVLVRTSIFEQEGPLDEKFMNTKEHLDFCMTVAQTGGTVYLEPASLVTYVPGPPQELSDVLFYMLRWSDGWTRQSLERMQEKWGVAEDGYFQNKYKKLGWRRRETLIRPLSTWLSLGFRNWYLEAAIARVDKLLNRWLTFRHAQKMSQGKPSTISNA